MTIPSTTPTSTPIPSTNIQDFKFNSELLDILVNESQETAASRLGVSLQTWSGIVSQITAQFGDLTDDLEAQSTQALQDLEAAIATELARVTNDADSKLASFEVDLVEQLKRFNDEGDAELAKVVDLADQAGEDRAAAAASASQSASAADSAQASADAASAIAVGDPSGLMTVSDAGAESRPLSSRATDLLDIKDFHLFGAATVDADYQSAADAARTRTPIIKHDETQAEAPDVQGRSNLVFEGIGEIAGSNWDSGFYRRQVIHPLAPSAVAVPDARMNLDVTGDSVTIVVTGDSLTTFYADSVAARDGFTPRLERKFREDNPNVEVNVIGRGVGAQTFSTLDGTPTANLNQYPWYTDENRAWLDYIADLSPDYVLVSMGMNDQQNFSRAAMESVLAKIEAMGAKPILVTNMVPNLSPNANNSSVAEYDAQEGRDFVAGYVRTYARFHNIPLIDVNRTFGLIRDGRDVMSTYLRKLPKLTFAAPDAFSADDEHRCRDFTMTATLDDNAFTATNPLTITFADNVSNNFAFIDAPNGFLRFRFYRGGSSSLYLTDETDIAVPSGNCVAEFSLVGGDFSFRLLNGTASSSAGYQPRVWPVIRHGGLLNPTISFFGGGGPIWDIVLAYGVECPAKPLLTDHQLWGDTSGQSGSLYPTGGNAVNHPTSYGASVIYGEHFKRQNYGFNRVPEFGSTANGTYIKHPDGRLECFHTLTFASGATTAQGAGFVSSATSWTFPITFVERPMVSVAVNNYNLWGVTNSGNAATQGVQLKSFLSVAASVEARVWATGKWK